MGLASWILEKFYFWSDHGDDLLSTFPPDMLIDNLMIYWATETNRIVDARLLRPSSFSGTIQGDRPRQGTDRNLHVAQGSGDYSQGMGGAVLQRSPVFLAEARGPLSSLGGARCLCSRRPAIRGISEWKLIS